MTGPVLILDAGDVALVARRLRRLPDDQLDGVQPVDLRRAAALLRAGAYSATVTARHLDRLATRQEKRS